MTAYKAQLTTRWIPLHIVHVLLKIAILVENLKAVQSMKLFIIIFQLYKEEQVSILE